jgi:hypothetical protein
MTLRVGDERGICYLLLLVVGIQKSRQCATRSNNKRPIQMYANVPQKAVVGQGCTGLVFGLVYPRRRLAHIAAVQDKNDDEAADMAWASRSRRVAPSPCCWCAARETCLVSAKNGISEWGPGGLSWLHCLCLCSACLWWWSRSWPTWSTEPCRARRGRWMVRGVRHNFLLLLPVVGNSIIIVVVAFENGDSGLYRRWCRDAIDTWLANDASRKVGSNRWPLSAAARKTTNPTNHCNGHNCALSVAPTARTVKSHNNMSSRSATRRRSTGQLLLRIPRRPWAP